MRKIIIFTILLVLLPFGVVYADSNTANSRAALFDNNRYVVAGIKDALAFDIAFYALKDAIAANNRDKVAEYILYPLRVNYWVGADKKRTTKMIYTKEELLANYNRIFTKRVKGEIAKQKLEGLFVNADGVMVGSGIAWLNQTINKPLRYGIITINLGSPSSFAKPKIVR
ncbi:MAG: hypothetical protein H6Q73_2284 [Firmicutes bacterium]|nr:hypothetical protein [Bacillota bacterium]